MTHKNFTFPSLQIKQLFFFIILLSSGLIRAQDAKWMPVLNNYDGTNTNEGIEANYKMSTCNGEAVLLLKFNNTTSKSFKVSWVYFLESNDYQKHYGTVKTSSVVMKANAVVTADCAGAAPDLKVRLSDFGLTPEAFRAVACSNFNIVPLGK
jgi:hypothetical protein